MQPNRSLFFYVEVLVIIVALIFGIKWLVNPEGAFEPTISFCSLILISIDLWRKHRAEPLPPPLSGEPTPTVEVSAAPEKLPDSLSPFPFASGCAFFSHRFAQAFPGIREPRWFQGKDAVERLAVLLAPPLRFSLPERGEKVPVWWFRAANNAIDQFQILDPTTILIDYQELSIKRICAFHSNNYKHQFVYLEASPSLPTGLYSRTNEQFQAALKEFGYVWEEYGLFKDTHKVSRAEYDDNSALILGKVVPLGGECELRTRYLTPYNFVICGNDSPINNPDFDETLKLFMDRVLAGEDCLAEFANKVKLLPSRLYG